MSAAKKSKKSVAVHKRRTGVPKPPVNSAADVIRAARSRRKGAGDLVVLVGPSGVGKTSLSRAAIDALKGSLAWSVSHTTRPARKGEREGRDYYFVEAPAFEKMIRKGEFVEHALVHGNYYGTSKAELRRIRRSGASALLEIDVQGALQVIEQFPEAVTVFVLPPSMAALKRRLNERATDSAKVIRTRVANAEAEIRWAPRFAYQVVNDDFDRALADFIAIVRAARCRQRR